MINKRGKKGQVTLFIIIAVIVVAIAVLVVAFWPRISTAFMSQQQTENFLASQVEPLRSSIYDCIEPISRDAFLKIGLQGGYYNTELYRLYFAGNDFTIVMFKDAQKNRINKLPSLSEIEQQYSSFLEKEGNQKIDTCLNDFSSFRKKMNIETGKRTITADIQNDKIVINIDWPITISKKTARGKASQEINQEPIELDMPLGNLWQVANYIVDCETQVDCNYEGIEWDKHTWDRPFDIQYIKKDEISLNENQIVFLLESIPQKAGEEPYKFYFAVDRS